MYSSSNPLNLCRSALRDLLSWARRSWKTASFSIGVAIAIVHLTVAFVPFPDPIAPGLDTAWQYRLSQLAAEDAIFGRDAVSFYGALGYWLRGAVIGGDGDNFDSVFIVRLSVHLLLVAIALLKLARLRDPLMRWALAIGLIFPYALSDIVPVLQTEWQIGAAWLLLLSMREFWGKGRRPWAIGLGAAAGVIANASPDLGIAAIVSLLLCLGLRNWADWQRHPGLETGSCIVLELFETVLACGVTALLAIAPSDGDLLWRLVVAIGAAVTIGYGLLPRLLRRLPISRFVPAIGNAIARLDRRGDLKQIGACCIFAIVLVYIACFTEPSLLAYLRGYWSLTASYGSALSPAPSEAIVGFGGYLQGYVAALRDRLDVLPAGMTYGGSPLEWRLVTVEVLAIAIAVVLTVFWGDIATAIAVLPFVFVAIDRPSLGLDREVLAFVFSAPLLLAIVVSTWQPQRLRRVGNLVQIAMLLFCLWSFAYYVNTEDYAADRLRILAPDRVAAKLGKLLAPQRLQDEIERQSADNLVPLTLSDSTREKIGDRSVEILPWETTIVAANDFNWQPLPVVPLHLAYSAYLDRLNRDSLADAPRDLVFYRFESLADRHPFFDAPATAFQLWCDYQIDADLQPWISEELDDRNIETPPWLALSPRSRERCGAPTAETTLTASWNRQFGIATPQDTIVRAAIDVRYSWLGAIVKTLFHAPPVYLTVWDGANESDRYRLSPDNAIDGILLSPLPRTPEEAAQWFAGQFPKRIYGLEFSTANLGLFAPTIEVVLTEYQPRGVVDRRL